MKISKGTQDRIIKEPIIHITLTTLEAQELIAEVSLSRPVVWPGIWFTKFAEELNKVLRHG